MTEPKFKCPCCGGDHEHYQCPGLCNINPVQSAKIEALKNENERLNNTLDMAIQELTEREKYWREQMNNLTTHNKEIHNWYMSLAKLISEQEALIPRHYFIPSNCPKCGYEFIPPVTLLTTKENS